MKTIRKPYFPLSLLKAMSTCKTGKISLYNIVNKIWGFLVMDHEFNVSPHLGWLLGKTSGVLVRFLGISSV